ncbi:MAG: acyl-CoA dehydrogenase family protein [Chloroflexi bacterium]|nr:acyl-CoA dehydrogenase family protein [Chloroflexota bacterium]
MNFNDTPEEATFRQEVRDFLDKELPERFKGTMDRMAGGGGGDMRSRFEEMKEWRKKLADKGWIAAAWPKEYGGAGLGTMEQFIMNEEFAENRAPQVGGMGVSMIGPTLIIHGDDEQKDEHLSRILSGEVQWCQGFSEPESGSDLASLQTKAVRDGDDYVINGQKIWTSGAQYAHWMFMMARTDPDAPKHKGISYFMLDMKSPGVSVRPLVNMAGNSMFNEVFFDNVRVPAKNLIGEENRGWYIGTTTLDFERSSIGSAVGQRLQVDTLIRFAKEHKDDHQSVLGRHETLRYELADRLLETHVARMLSYRVVTMQNKGLVPNYEASMCKLYSSEMSQRIARTSMKVTGLYGQLLSGTDWAPAKGRYGASYIQTVASTIAGGTSEVQRGIIATRGLGLPKN